MKAFILVVEDDVALVGELLKPALREAGYRVRHADHVDSAYACLAHETVDLILLDVQLPGISGFQFLEILKRDSRIAHIPVIMLTTTGGEAAKVRGLKGGADDYLVKPFSVKELLARVEAVLRRVRHEGKIDRVIETSGIRLDYDSREVTANGRTANLTSIEFEFLARLLQQPRRVLTYQVLSAALSESGRIMTSETLYAHVRNLRRKLGAAGDRIETVYDLGYKFVPK